MIESSCRRKKHSKKTPLSWAFYPQAGTKQMCSSACEEGIFDPGVVELPIGIMIPSQLSKTVETIAIKLRRVKD